MTDYEKLLEEIERRTDAWAETWRATAGTSDGDERTQDVRALAAALREVMVERDTAKRELAEYAEQDDRESAERLERYRAVQGEGDLLLKSALGPVWSKMWGPELEKLGAVVDDLLVRATAAEGTRDTALADVEAMRAVVRAAEQLAMCDLSRFSAELAERVGAVRQALRALDARATPNAKETR